MKRLENKRVLVVGMGKSGIAAIQALLKLGAKVTVQDIKGKENFDSNFINFLEGVGVNYYFGREPDDKDIFDLVVLSPGVPANIDFIDEAKARGAEIVGELEIAYRVGQGTYVAITGTNGKTTTTSLVGEIFKEAGRKTFIVGNIGVAVISRSLIASKDSWMVTEVSSFQLETIRTFRPFVAAILNITEDHMDRHKSMGKYIEAKAEIFKNQGEKDYLILNYDDPKVRELAEKARSKIVFFSRLEELKKGAFLRDGQIVISDGFGKKEELLPVNALLIPGDHNVENALAAVAISYFSGVSSEAIAKVLREFTGVSHRLEFVEEINKIRFINDSKATNPDSTIKALLAMGENIVLIAGGFDKGSSYDSLLEVAKERVKSLVLLGKTAETIKEAASKKGFKDIELVKDMGEAVQKAVEKAEAGDTVLLSPACASWDMYENFEQRGEHFKSLVHNLNK